ncbi:hypothetical protein [Nocardioides eburneiflavus]|nr:hypothetical protein [Nocardioides eburneiflavus]
MRIRLMRGLAIVVAAMTISACGAETGAPSPKQPAPDQSESGKAQPASPTDSGSPDSAYFAQERMNPRRFLRQWVAASDKMQVTGRTAPIVSMISGCEPCEGFVETVEEVYADNGTVDFAGTSIVRIVKAQGSDSVYLLTKDVAPTVVHHGDGRLEKYPGGRTTFRYILEPDGDSWNVAHFFIEPN